MGRLFGTDGARGVAVTELTCEIAMNIGKALAMLLVYDKPEDDLSPPHIIIGKDTRISSDTLEAAIVAGVTAAGGNAALVGIVPTPAVAYFVREYSADAGIMITASHNSAEFNGIKLFNKDGCKFPDEREDEIEAYVYSPESILLKEGREVGRVTRRDSAIHDYITTISGLVTRDFEGMKILVDCANGCAAVPAREIFSGFGADCTIINNSPNGFNINDNCGSTYIEGFAKQVVEGKYQLGLSFDGDADRLLAVDERGNIVDGDKIIALTAVHMRQRGKLSGDTVVVTVMSNLGFHQYIGQNGLRAEVVPVGDRYVSEKMASGNCSIGGEQSGHIIFREHSTTGDGMITAIKLLNMVRDRQLPLSVMADQIPTFPQTLKNVVIAADKKGAWENNPAVTAEIERVRAEAGPESRILIRESGTEPLLRVMIEGKNQQQIEAWADRICAVAQQELS